MCRFKDVISCKTIAKIFEGHQTKYQFHQQPNLLHLINIEYLALLALNLLHFQCLYLLPTFYVLGQKFLCVVYLLSYSE